MVSALNNKFAKEQREVLGEDFVGVPFGLTNLQDVLGEHKCTL